MVSDVKMNVHFTSSSVSHMFATRSGGVINDKVRRSTKKTCILFLHACSDKYFCSKEVKVRPML